MKSYFNLKDASVSYNVYTKLSERSLKNTIISNIGGSFIKKNKNNYINAINKVTMNIVEGDRIGLIGPNGSGKSTFLKLLSGCLEPTSGYIKRYGNISSILNLAMGLDGELTGIENIKLFSAIKNLSSEQAENFLIEVSNFSELGKFLNMTVETYSDGMKLRLAFAIATSDIPDVLLLDEIVNVGDSSFSLKASERINSLIDNSKVMILATHNEEIMNKYCNKYIAFNNGNLKLNKL